MFKISNRSEIQPFIVMDVMRAANERAAIGNDVIHLEVGQPNSCAPTKVLEMAKSTLNTDKLGYTDALGTIVLKERIAKYYFDAYGVNIELERIVITTGSSGGLALSFLSSFDVGDHVGLATPGYPAYKNMLKALGINVLEIAVASSSRFQLTKEILQSQSIKLDGLIISSPSNPTGSMISSQNLNNLANWCETEGVRLISDEVYHGIVYGKPAATALRYSKNAIIVNSFSKYFSMTGWRLGWMIVPADMMRSIECLAQNFFVSPPSLSQQAAVGAFDCMQELNHHVSQYKVNRDLLLNELPKARLDKFAPVDGAFYIYTDVSHLTDDSSTFCKDMLDEIGVAMTPGIDFDAVRGKSFVRLCFEDIHQATIKLKNWLA